MDDTQIDSTRGTRDEMTTGGSGGMSGSGSMGDSGMSSSGGMGGSGGMGDSDMGGTRGAEGGQHMISVTELRQMMQRGGTNISPEIRSAIQQLVQAAENDPQAQDEATRARGSATFIATCYIYTCEWEY